LEERKYLKTRTLCCPGRSLRFYKNIYRRIHVEKNKVYISGRITGEANLLHFDEESARLEALGYIPVNPARLVAVFVHNEGEREFWMRELRYVR
jgi:hypothetical protein